MATDSRPPTVARQIVLGTEQLKPVTDNPRLDAELLLCHTLGWARTSLYTRNKQLLTNAQHAQYHALIRQRANGMPVAYLLQSQEFWSYPLWSMTRS